MLAAALAKYVVCAYYRTYAILHKYYFCAKTASIFLKSQHTENDPDSGTLAQQEEKIYIFLYQ